MKKNILLAFLLSATLIGNATIYFDETFNHSTGATLATAAGWTAGGTIGTGVEPVISETSLAYSNSGGNYCLSGLGKTVLQTYATGSTNYYVSKPFSATAVTSGVVYLSFLYSPNAVSQAQTGSVAIYLGGTTSGAQFWVGKGAINTSNFRFGVTRSSTSNSTVTWNSTEYTSDNTVYFIVLKYDFSTSAASIFVNPIIASASEPTPSATDNSVSSAPSSLQNVVFKMNGSNKNNNKIGAIRVSTTWADAVASGAAIPNNDLDAINTNFGDATWGATATSYTSGSYPTTTINGFDLVKAFLQSSTLTCVTTGESHSNRILLDKSSQNASIEFPAVKTIGELEIHAATGTDAMSFRVEEWVNNQWQLLDTYNTRKSSDSVYLIPLVRNVVTKLRIANNTSSGLYLYKIRTRTLLETTELNLKNSSPIQGEVVFSNLKNTITLTFNKNIEALSGTITLNGVAIPLINCTITNATVTIPVVLTNIPGANKNYSLTVTAGAFGETGNLTNLSKAINLSFQTLKAVAYPTNYNGLIDVVYKNVNSPNTRMDVYYPTNVSTPVPVVINMHGGGWVGGFKEEQGGFDMYFNRGYAVVNVEYRMRNEILAPAAVEDVRSALHYVLNHAQGWNIDPQKIIFQGGSAGGHLALIAGYLQNNRIYDNECVQYTGDIKVMAVIDKYGAAELISFTPVYSGMVAWLGSRSTDETFIRSLSPVHWITPQTPPTFIIHGDADPTIPYSQSVALQAALQTAGVKNSFTTVPGGLHGGFPTIYNTQFESDVLTFIDEVLTNITTVTIPEKSLDNTKIQIKNNTITIDSEDNIKTTVYNALGNKIYSTNANTFNISTKGFYIVKMEFNNRTTITKFLID